MKNTTSAAAVVIAISSVEKSFDETMKCLQFAPNGSVTLTKGKTLSAMEAGMVAGELVNRGESVRIQAANMLRFSRSLPAIEGVPAVDIALLQFRKVCKSEGEFATVNRLLPAIDFIEANKLNVSPFVALEVMGTLRATGALKDKAKENPTLSLTNGDDELAKPIVDKLRDGTATANGIRKTCSEVKEAKEKLAKEKADALAAQMKGNKDNALPVGTTPPVEAPKTSPEISVKLAIHAAVRLWDKAVGEGTAASVLRNVCKEDVEAIARLAGFKLSPL